jgi:hypothetical protein
VMRPTPSRREMSREISLQVAAVTIIGFMKLSPDFEHYERIVAQRRNEKQADTDRKVEFQRR